MVLNLVVALCLALIGNAVVILIVWDHVDQSHDEEDSEDEHFRP